MRKTFLFIVILLGLAVAIELVSQFSSAREQEEVILEQMQAVQLMCYLNNVRRLRPEAKLEELFEAALNPPFPVSKEITWRALSLDERVETLKDSDFVIEKRSPHPITVFRNGVIYKKVREVANGNNGEK
jgi:hypothetical protein